MQTDKNAYDAIRWLRIAIKNDEQHLTNAPLGPRQKAALKKQVAQQKERLKELNAEKREKRQDKSSATQNCSTV